MERVLEIKLRGKERGQPLAPKVPAAAAGHAQKAKTGNAKLSPGCWSPESIDIYTFQQISMTDIKRFEEKKKFGAFFFCSEKRKLFVIPGS